MVEGRGGGWEEEVDLVWSYFFVSIALNELPNPLSFAGRSFSFSFSNLPSDRIDDDEPGLLDLPA